MEVHPPWGAYKFIRPSTFSSMPSDAGLGAFAIFKVARSRAVGGRGHILLSICPPPRPHQRQSQGEQLQVQVQQVDNS